MLARQYVVIGEDAKLAEEEWRTTLDHGGAVVWTATLYDVDTKSYFVMAFDRESLRVYRFGELAGRFDTHFGLPQFPGGDRERLWRAWGGCIDAAARPEVVIPWADVREIKAGNWVLYFKLAHKVRITSDRGKKADVDEIKVNLHGASGSIDVRTTRDPIDPWKVDVHTTGHRAAGLSGTHPAHAGGVGRSRQSNRAAEGIAQRGLVGVYSGRRNVRIASRNTSPKSAAFFAPTP